MSIRGAVPQAPLVSALCALCALLLVLGVGVSAGAQESKDQVLPGCGICYPGGYDPNTVGEVRGRAYDIVVPTEGPVSFAVTGDEERWVVLASPAWFWRMTSLRLAAGDAVAVRGSKSLGADGKLYIVAQTVQRLDGTSSAVLLRDSRGLPLWRGSHGGGETRGGGAGQGRGPATGRGQNGGGSGRR